MTKNQLTTKAALLYIICVCLFFGFFAWTPDVLIGQLLRCIFFYLAGLSALIYLVVYKFRGELSKNELGLLAAFILFSLIGLLRGNFISDTLFGRPLSHVSLLSFGVSISIGLLFSLHKRQPSLFEYTYYVIFSFSFFNLLYYLIFPQARLGAFGLHINYTAHIIIIGLIIGLWLLQNYLQKSKKIIGMQFFMWFCVVMTLSRTALLFVIPLFLYQLYILWQTGFRKITLAFALITILSGSLFISVRGTRVTNSSYQKESLAYRYQLLQSATPNSTPALLFGEGIGSIEHNFNVRGHQYNLIEKDLSQRILFESSHNYFVDIVVERGLVTFVLFCILLIHALRKGLSSNRKEDKLLMAILITSLVFMMINNIGIQQELIILTCMLSLLVTAQPKKQLT